MDYFSISDNEEKELNKMFNEWIDWFLTEFEIDRTKVIGNNGKGTEYTVDDYVQSIKDTFGYQSPCKQYLSAAYVSGGPNAVYDLMESTALLVIDGLNIP